MALKKISDRDQNLLCATTCINSFKRAIEELIYNSLDAESTSIAIRLCVEKKYIQILDNGTGISKSNFRHLGEKYVTSKFIDVATLKTVPNKYGFKGISLASIIEISENVKISSKVVNSQETWMKIFLKGKEEEFCLTTLRPSQGTTVEVSGFLYNLCIQQKCVDTIDEISGVKLILEQLSLVHSNVSLSLRDESKNEIIFKIHKNRDIYQTLWSLFKITTSDIQELQVEKNEYKVKAYIGKNVLALKKYQWIYLNGRTVTKSFLYKKINETLNKKMLIKTSNKGKIRFEEEKNFSCKIPFYFIFISCPYFDFDINYNNKHIFVEFKNCDEVNKLIEKLINFYCGDITLKPVNVKEGINIKTDNETRNKVKEIIDKILKKNDPKQNITQLQNGRKGKNITRKEKKKRNVNNTLQNTLTKYKNNSKTKQMIKYLETKNHRKSTLNILNNRKLEFIHSNVNKNRNGVKRKEIIKTAKKNYAPCVQDEPLIKKFKEPTESVKDRCHRLSHEAQRLLSKEKNHNDTNKFSMVNSENDSTNFNFEASEFILKNPKKADCNSSEYQIYPFKCTKVTSIKTSHDLLKTTDVKDIFHMSQDKLTATQDNGPIYENGITNCTFNSHMNKKVKQLHSANDLQKDLNNIECVKSYLKQHTNTSGTENTCYENNMTLLSRHNKTSNIKSMNDLYSHINFNFQNTYTIDVLSSFNTINKEINETCSIQISTKLSSNSYDTRTLSVINDTATNTTIDKIKNNCKNICIPESSSNDEVIEPLIYCEAILGSTEMRNLDHEFNISFMDNEKDKKILNMSDQNCPNDQVKQKSQYFNEKNDDGSQQNSKINKPLLNNTLNDQRPNIELLEEINNKANLTENFKLQSRLTFVPKGMSQIFDGKIHKKGIYNIDNEYYENAIYKNFSDDIHNKFEIFEPSVRNVKDIVTRDLNKVNERINKINSDLIFNAESLKNAKVFGQIDRKFIAAIIQNRYREAGRPSEFLALFDQHAVDERITLETNLSDYFDGTSWKSVEIEPFNLKLTQENYFYLHNYSEKISQFGLQWTFTNADVVISAVPKAILGKHLRKTEVIYSATKNLISEKIEVIKSTKGNISLYPKSIMELVFSEACRYAIKFGQQLSRNDCVNMISALSTCKTPFQCAHGRPVMAIIMELLENNNRTYEINLNKIKKLRQTNFKLYKFVNK